MPISLERLEDLRDDFRDLAYKDEDKLSELDNRGRMLTRRAAGEDSDYYRRFVRIGFHVLISPSIEEYEKESWEEGQRQTVHLLNSMLEELRLDVVEKAPAEERAAVIKSNRVFIVHGHDNEMKQAVARTVERLGLKVVILHEQTRRGRTIIEQIERHSDVGFAVVLLSPDDTGYSNAAGSDAAKPRARQNVILELGYFAGKLGRESVVALHRGDIELPSDYDGVLYTPYDNDSGAWRGELVAELKESGYEVSADDL